LFIINVAEFLLPAFYDFLGNGVSEMKRDELRDGAAVEVWQITSAVPARCAEFFLV
jgi:hypothetical protein